MLKKGIIRYPRRFHKGCRCHSLVCVAQRREGMKVPPGLPNRSYVNLTASEEALINKVMDNKLGKTAVLRQRYNLTTNRCESTHLTVLKSVPKSRVYRRNFQGRANSAIHTSSVGLVESILRANSSFGASTDSHAPANKIRKTEIKRECYHKARKQSKHYRVSKKQGLYRKQMFANTHMQSGVGYSTGCSDPIVSKDHTYHKISEKFNYYSLRSRNIPT